MLGNLVKNTCLLALNSHSFGTTNLTYKTYSCTHKFGKKIEKKKRKEKKRKTCSNKSQFYFNVP
jgi:hypothetical protein